MFSAQEGTADGDARVCGELVPENSELAIIGMQHETPDDSSKEIAEKHRDLATARPAMSVLFLLSSYMIIVRPSPRTSAPELQQEGSFPMNAAIDAESTMNIFPQAIFPPAIHKGF